MHLLLFLYTCLIALFFTAPAREASEPFKASERFTASTPANNQIKAFLNIPLADSVDFIRWHLTFDEKEYKLSARYGLSKPNTNGFINDGQLVEITDNWSKSGSERVLNNGSKSIRLIALNSALLHFIDSSGKFMIGNGGWSYTLNNSDSKETGNIWAGQKSNILKDSVKYEGRTPSGIPGVPHESVYNKLKWQIIFYADAKTNTPTTYRAVSAPWRSRGGKRGTWKIVKDAQGGVIYQLFNEDDTVFVSLLKADDNILLFMDGNGGLLVGNEDFSYTLNKYF